MYMSLGYRPPEILAQFQQKKKKKKERRVYEENEQYFVFFFWIRFEPRILVSRCFWIPSKGREWNYTKARATQKYTDK